MVLTSVGRTGTQAVAIAPWAPDHIISLEYSHVDTDSWSVDSISNIELALQSNQTVFYQRDR